MAVFNILSFQGVNQGYSDNVSVQFNSETEILTAKTATDGFPFTVYSEYYPMFNEGDLVNTLYENGYKYDFFFTPYYPFATFTSEEDTPPVYDITVSVSKTDETAPNEKNGTATITATGGIGPYEYSLNNVNWQSSNMFEGLSFGNYVVYVRDSSGNNGSATFTIEQGQYTPAPPVLPTTPDLTCLANGELPKQGGFKRAIVKTVFGTTPSTLFNGDFEKFDGQNWDQWVKYGGINVSRGQRTVKNGSGIIVPIENYTLKFNEKASSGKYIEHTSIPVQQGDKIKLSLNIGNTQGTGVTNGTYQLGSYNIPAKITTTYELRIRVKIGNFYLYNQDGGSNYEWVGQLAVVTHRADNSLGNIDSYVHSINAPNAPVTGDMLIEIFGFAKIKETITEEFKIGVAIKIPPQYIKQELNEYVSVEIDDVKYSKSTQENDNEVDSITNISDNLDYFTRPLEQIEIPIGDLYVEDIGKPENETLYAIYDQDNKPTTGWIDYGVTTSPQPFGLALAKSLMQSYQASYEEFTGSLMLKKDAERFSYLDTFSFIVRMRETGLPAEDFNSKQFVILGCDIDLKENKMSNITSREYFKRIANTSDISIPTTPNTPLPPIVNDPNNDSKVIGIFTEEFTQEFQ